MAVTEDEIRSAIAGVRRILDQLEAKIGPESSAEVDPYTRRREILREIYWTQNNMDKSELLSTLRERGTTYAWIGQQVKKGYLVTAPVPGGGARYSVTPKAIREQRLEEADKEETMNWTALSEESFAEDWDSDEDSVYDAL
jgi:hypothetical protein